MAILATGELGEDTCRMGCAMAVLALGYHFMLALVAGYAQQLAVLGGAGLQQIGCCFVTGCTVSIRQLCCISDNTRHMGLVAVFALCCGHFGGVRFVALGTLGNFTMNVMAERAVERRVFALVIPELFDLGIMAGKTYVGHIPSKGNILRFMGILVAAQAFRQFIVGLTAVALITLGNRLFDRGRVSHMAVNTGYTGFVSSARSFNVSGWIDVALGAVSIGKCNSLCRCCRCCCRRRVSRHGATGQTDNGE